MARQRIRLTTSGQAFLIVTVATGVSALIFDHPAPALIFCFTISLLLVSLPAGHWLMRLELEELAPGRLLEGETRALDLRHTIRGRFPLTGIRLRGSEDLFGLEGELPLASAGRHGRTSVVVSGKRRGRCRGAQIGVATTAPFGLIRHQRRLRVPTDIWILPQTQTLRESVLEEMLQLRPRGLDLPQPTGPGDGEFFAMREFREGDSERRVHPRLSARRGQKVIRIFRGEAPPLVHLVLDLRSPGGAQTFQSVDFDEAVRFAAGIVRSLLLRQVPVDFLLIGAEGVERVASPQCRDLHVFLAALALVRPVPTTQEPAGFALPPGCGNEGRKVVVHLGKTDETALGPEWIAIQAGSRRYYQLLEPQFTRSHAP